MAGFDFSGRSNPLSGGGIDNGGFALNPSSSFLKDIPAIAWIAVAVVAAVVLVKVTKR
jgi:hypothetical protein